MIKEENLLRKNILKFYISQILIGIEFTAPIYVLFLLSNGLTLAQVAIIGSIQAIIIGFLEIPSGILADFFGRKRTLMLASIGALIGAIIYVFSQSFTFFILAAIFYAIALSFKSGTDTAWIYDTLKNLRLEKKFKKIKGKGDLFRAIAFFISQGAITLFVVNNYRLYFVLMIPMSILVFLVILTYKEPRIKRKKSNLGIKKEFRIHIKDSFKVITKSRFLTYIFSLLALESIIGSAYYFLLLQPHLEKINYPIAFLGLLWAIMGLLMGIGSYFSDSLEIKIGKKLIILTAPIIIFLPILVLGLTTSIIITLIAILFAQFTIGIYYIIFEDYINQQVKSDKRATIMSSKNFFRYIAWGIFAPLIGFIADKMSISITFILLALAGLLIGYLITLNYLSRNQHKTL